MCIVFFEVKVLKKMWIIFLMLACALSLRVFLPLLAAPSVGRIVVIDAGHGGFDGGAQGAHASEKDLNLAVAKSLKAALEERGYFVVMTREEDIALKTVGEKLSTKKSDMRERLCRIRASGAALLISVHMNHFSESKYRGAQVFYNKEGREAALLMQEALRQMDPSNTRQAKFVDGELYLLSHADMPACLLECGFLSNPAEEKLLMDATYRSLLAQTVANAVDVWSKSQRENGGKEIIYGESKNRFSLQ